MVWTSVILSCGPEPQIKKHIKYPPGYVRDRQSLTVFFFLYMLCLPRARPENLMPGELASAKISKFCFLNAQDSLEFETMSSLVPPPIYSCREGAMSHASLCVDRHVNHANEGRRDDGPRSAPMYPHEGQWPEALLPSPYSFEDLPGMLNHAQGYLPPAAPSSTFTHNDLLRYSPSQPTHETMAVASFDSHAPLESPPTWSRRHPGHVSAPDINLFSRGTFRSRPLYHHSPASLSRLSSQPPTVAHEPDDEASDGPECQNIHSGSTVCDHSRPPKELVSMNPRQGRPTNFVFLSRKSKFKRRASFPFFPSRQKSESSSSITGSFVIDPHLRLPLGLFKAVDSGLPLDHALATTTSLRTRKNLVLEVENGSINVDIHLTPSTSPHRVRDSSTEPPGMHRELYRSSTDRHRLHSDSVCEKRDIQRPYSYSRQTPDPRDAPMPTRMEFRLKAGMRLPNSEKYELIARVNAPSPRSPIHLLASTIDDNPPPTADDSDPRRTKSKSRRLVQSHHPRPRPRPTKDPRPKKSNNKSPVYLHLPRTLHGPLTIHVASGNIDDHVRLSKELRSVAVILRESPLSRGYFVSATGLAEFGFADRDGEGGWVWVAQPDSAGSTTSGYDDSLLANGSGSSVNGPPQAGGWYGDKVDVLVGDGRVYLQFIGEEDPFGRQKGFWQSLVGY